MPASPHVTRNRMQLDALREAGCERIFEETAGGAKRERPELRTALDFSRGRHPGRVEA